MMTEHFADDLATAVRRAGHAAVVGLDPRWEMLPTSMTAGVGDSLTDRAEVYRRFCCETIDVVASLAPAVKPQLAFFEALGPPGMQALWEVIRYAQDHGLLVIADGKRNDIGSTAEGYARAWLGRGESPWSADALTVSPYLGEDSLTPFVDIASGRGAGLFVLVKTSNAGGGLLQDLQADQRPVYRHAAELVERLSAETEGACGYGLVGAVVGATYPEQLAELRTAMPHTWFLVPGFGAQGGQAQDVAPAFDGEGLGAVINNSRAIIFAYRRDEYRDAYGEPRWQEAVEAATREMIDQLAEAVTIAT